MSTAGKIHRFNIENGPSMGLLVDAFKYAYDETVKIPVTFVVAKGYTAPLGDPGCAFEPLEMNATCITTLQHECGNSHSFNIEGNCRVALGKEHFETVYDAKERVNVCKKWTDLVPARFEAYFDTKSRKGTITFFT